ncbi:hypothetical protein [Pigmentibacter ruber]|nr:hypothetical protein [Pigmentibacter ruber]
MMICALPEIDFASQNRNMLEGFLGSYTAFLLNHFDTLVVSIESK